MNNLIEGIYRDLILVNGSFLAHNGYFIYVKNELHAWNAYNDFFYKKYGINIKEDLA